MVEILQRACADRRADEGLQVHRCRLVAHVGRLRQVLVPHRPREECVEIGRLEPGMARGIEDRLFGIVHRPQLAADLGEGLLPRDRHVAVARGVVAHRLRQPAGLFEVVVVQLAQLRKGVLREELGVGAALVELPQGGLRAVLAEFEGAGFGRFRPGAGRAHHAAGLVQLRQDVERAGRAGRLAEDARNPAKRSPAPGGMLVMGRIGILLGGGVWRFWRSHGSSIL